MDTFSDLQISTTTVTAALPTVFNIVDIAKYLPLDHEIIGVKLVYAGGSSKLIRGTAKLSKKDKDFYNQVTVSVRYVVPGHVPVLMSCKVFHNGTLHVTGSRTLDEAKNAANLLLARLRILRIARLIRLQPEKAYLASLDNVLYSSRGKIIGWVNTEHIYLHSEFVVQEKYQIDGCEYDVFVSRKWNRLTKSMYTLDGDHFGERTITLNNPVPRRSFDVKFGMVYYRNRIIGKEDVTVIPCASALLEDTLRYGSVLRREKLVPHYGRAYELDSGPADLVETDFTLHMINMYFRSPFAVNRGKLHTVFMKNGYYSRFDQKNAVNLRYHYPLTGDETLDGRCPHPHTRKCYCKDISVSIFHTGKMNVTGLKTHEQGRVVYDSIKRFFLKHRDSFEILPLSDQ